MYTVGDLATLARLALSLGAVFALFALTVIATRVIIDYDPAKESE